MVGLPTVFVRLTGCPLRCQYCDTAYAFQGGVKMTQAEILAKITSYNTPYVCITGGEPLAQKGCKSLLNALAADFIVSLETSGAMDISGIDARLIKVLDIKTPDSKEEKRNLFSNLQYLTKNDQIKFVICSQDDYEWSKKLLQEHQLPNITEVLFSPSHGQVKDSELADWIIADQLPVRFQTQLHKYLWGDEPGR